MCGTPTVFPRFQTRLRFIESFLPMKSSERLTTAEIAETIEAQGAEFTGLQDAPKGRLVLFIDAVTRTTLALPECEVSAEAIARRLRDSRKQHALTA
jgi:hypothetical protein